MTPAERVARIRELADQIRIEMQAVNAGLLSVFNHDNESMLLFNSCGALEAANLGVTLRQQTGVIVRLPGMYCHARKDRKDCGAIEEEAVSA